MKNSELTDGDGGNIIEAYWERSEPEMSVRRNDNMMMGMMCMMSMCMMMCAQKRSLAS